ncbi:MAG: DUF308 domain-containing protein [Butyrivibrio sp.]|nr:DUF308 domain-containing protein [Butyrivibrio sp.]
MTFFQRFRIILYGLVQLAMGIIMFAIPEDGTRLALLMVGLYLILTGYKNIWYYLVMARFMVDGRMALIQGVIMIDFGYLASSITDVPRIYILLYLMIMHAFAGLVEILRALEEKRFGEKHWKLKFSHGIANLVIVILCVVFIQNNTFVVMIFAAGLVYSAILRVISGLRKSSFGYIH